MNKKYDFQLKGYEYLELSTQIIIKEALKRAIKVEILDRKANFIRLSKGKIVEYIKQATMTSKDSYATFCIMENKEVTKTLLKEHDIRTPKGRHYSNLKSLENDHKYYSKFPCVIKPNTSNFGLSIHFHLARDTKAAYTRSARECFQYSETLIVEEYIEGKEYRFLMVDYRVIAISHRVPANITGNGKNTIKELVDMKNRDEKRGEGYRGPLVMIHCGETEKVYLKEQKLTLKSVPVKGKTIYLRQNSNLSTGGDSYDVTDLVHPSYKKIAKQAAQAVGSRLTGLDMIIPDISTQANKNNYSVIELNFNPAIYFHNYPYRGENRHVGKAVVDSLGF